MKRSNLFLVAISMALVFVSCKSEDTVKTTIVDFEDVTLNASGFWNGSNLSGTALKEEAWGTPITNYYGSFKSVLSNFDNIYTSEWDSWKGFACSSKTDTVTAGWGNQYSAASGTGALNSKKFALAYESASFTCPADNNGPYSIKSLMLTNSTYTYLYIKSFTSGSWLKVIVTGYLSNKETSKIEYYLSDFRDNKKILLNKWTNVDVSALGSVDKVTFTVESNDVMAPTYVCIDNIEFTQTISTK